MKPILFLLLLFPLSVKAQFFPLDKWGVRTAYTHTNSSRSFGFVGVSLNHTEVDSSGLAACGAKVYVGAHLGKSAKIQLIPEVGADAFFILPVGVGVSINTEAIEPRIGFTFVNAVEFYFGHSYPFKENSAFRGATFTLVLNIFQT